MVHSTIDDPTRIAKQLTETRIPYGQENEEETSQNKDIIARARQISEYESQIRKRGSEHNEFLSEISGVLKEMAEEQAPKTRLPVDDVDNLVSSVIAQRNIALNRSAVEQARTKSLLKLLEIKEKVLLDKSAKIEELEEKLERLEKQLAKKQKTGNQDE